MGSDKQTARLVVKLTHIFQGNMMGAAKEAGPRINEQFPKVVPLWYQLWIQDFPLGGAPTCWGVPTSDAYAFQ